MSKHRLIPQKRKKKADFIFVFQNQIFFFFLQSWNCWNNEPNEMVG